MPFIEDMCDASFFSYFKARLFFSQGLDGVIYYKRVEAMRRERSYSVRVYCVLCLSMLKVQIRHQ